MTDYLGFLFNRITNVLRDLGDVIIVGDKNEFKNYYKSVNIISFLHSNLTVKRVIPMLVAKMIYNKQKNAASGTNIKQTTHLIIDEAHNILGSVRSKSDYWQKKKASSF